jgi:hypothetical protein
MRAAGGEIRGAWNVAMGMAPADATLAILFGALRSPAAAGARHGLVAVALAGFAPVGRAKQSCAAPHARGPIGPDCRCDIAPGSGERRREWGRVRPSPP